MKLIKVLFYKTTYLKVYDNGMEDFPYEYEFYQNNHVVKSRTSYKSISICMYEAKVDFDMEDV